MRASFDCPQHIGNSSGAQSALEKHLPHQHGIQCCRAVACHRLLGIPPRLNGTRSVVLAGWSGDFLLSVVPPLFGSGTRIGWLSTITAGLLGPSLLGISLPRIRNTNANTVPSTSVHGTPPRYRLSAVLTVVLQLACKVGKTSSLATLRKTAHSTF